MVDFHFLVYAVGINTTYTFYAYSERELGAIR